MTADRKRPQVQPHEPEEPLPASVFYDGPVCGIGPGAKRPLPASEVAGSFQPGIVSRKVHLMWRPTHRVTDDLHFPVSNEKMRVIPEGTEIVLTGETSPGPLMLYECKTEFWTFYAPREAFEPLFDDG